MNTFIVDIFNVKREERARGRKERGEEGERGGNWRGGIEGRVGGRKIGER